VTEGFEENLKVCGEVRSLQGRFFVVPGKCFPFVDQKNRKRM
jgi:hypothetical protein